MCTSNRADRQLSWHAHCSNALVRFDQVNDGHQGWTRPAFLRHWHNLRVPTPAATATR
jgi:hypothetical protein